MRIVIAGAGGLLGTALRRSYVAEGHTVIRLVRTEPTAEGERHRVRRRHRTRRCWPVPTS